MPAIALSALDLSPLADGESATSALHATAELAGHVESLGYARFWVAEHHNAGALACPSPELVASFVLSRTSTIRVGSGGVMLPNHAPLRVAEAFRVLSAMFPGRVDLGIGRAPGTDKRTAKKLRRAPEEDFPAMLEELLGYLGDATTRREPFATSVVAAPLGVPAPPTWLLGTSVESAELSGRMGLGYAFAQHFSPLGAVEALTAYRRAFTPSPRLAAPHAILAVACGASDDPQTAEDLVALARLGALRMARGERDLPSPSVATARTTELDDEARAIVAPYAERAFVGRTWDVVSGLASLVETTSPDELMITTTSAPTHLRRDTYTVLARELSTRKAHSSR